MQQAVEYLFSKYKEQGYLTENEMFDYVDEHDLDLSDIQRVTDKLLSLGVIFHDPQKEERDAARIDYDSLYGKVIEELPEAKTLVRYIKSIKPPQRNEWQTLVPQAKNGNLWAYNRMFDMYLRQVLKTAWNYHCAYEIPFGDAFQEGCIGLMYAIGRFDDTEHTSFPTYVTRPIVGHITRACDIPAYQFLPYLVSSKEDIIKIYNLVENHYCQECLCKKQKNECGTLVTEIMSVLNCSREDAIKHLNYYTAHEHEIYNLIDIDAKSPFDLCAQKNLEKVVSEIFSELTETEVTVLKERYGIDCDTPKTLEEVGMAIGVTRERVRQIEQKALNKLKHPARAKKLRSFLDDSREEVVLAEKTVQSFEYKETKIAEEPEKKKRGRPAKNKSKQIKLQLPWAEFDVRLLKKLYEQGCSAAEIARKVYKTNKEVREEIEKLGLDPVK